MAQWMRLSLPRYGTERMEPVRVDADSTEADADACGCVGLVGSAFGLAKHGAGGVDHGYQDRASYQAQHTVYGHFRQDCEQTIAE